MQCRLSSNAPGLWVRSAFSGRASRHFTCQFHCAAQNAANLFLTRAFSGKDHERGLPLVVSSFCPNTKIFAKGEARSFGRSLILDQFTQGKPPGRVAAGFSLSLSMVLVLTNTTRRAGQARSS
jgi:hypothetical protein